MQEESQRAQEIESSRPGSGEFAQGLRGVVVGQTGIGSVRGEEGFYHYRQYGAIDLARTRRLEEVWYLLFEGQLPEPQELARFRAEVAPLRELDGETAATLPALIGLPENPKDPMVALRSALSIMATNRSLEPLFDLTPAQRRRDALRVCAQVPTLVAALWRLSRGLAPVAPDPDLDMAADYLRMLGGTRPSPEIARALERYLIVTVDHGFNASTFTARVVAATGADMGAAAVAALGALSGPLHGGSPSRALETLDSIGSAEAIDSWVRPRIEEGQRIMGFGHPVYRPRDPRAEFLREISEQIGSPRIELAKRVEERILALLAELKPSHELGTNVEFYAGLVMEACGIAPDLFTPTFACSRVIGWSAHVLEQSDEGRIIRPSARYTGPPAPAPLPSRSRSGVDSDASAQRAS